MAVAGTVAPIFKGEYNSAAIYDFYNVINHNNKMWICKADGTVGIEPTEDNSDYWYLAIDGADAASLGGETSKEWQTKLDNIQTTSSGTLSEAGWYRVAEYNVSTASYLTGKTGNSCFISIKKTSSLSESYLLRLDSTATGQRIKPLSIKTDSVSNYNITKIRYTYDSSKAYLEVYKNNDTPYGYNFAISDAKDTNGCWQAITPTLTAETVDGVTVTTTYDIPANASPVTDLDLVRFEGTELLTTSILEKALTLSNGVWNFRLGGGSYTGNDLPNALYRYSVAKIEKRESTDLTVTLSAVATDINYGLPPIYNQYTSGGWRGWQKFATTTDLDYYTLPYNGSPVTNDDSLSTLLQHFHDDASDGQYYTRRIIVNYVHSVFGGGNKVVRGFKQSSTHGYQIVESWAGEYYISMRRIIEGTWTGWNKFTTESDLTTALANYLPKTGGDITGNIRQLLGNADASYRIKNNARDIEMYVDTNGLLRFMDNTNSAPIFTSTVDGTNSFKGTATGNLALDGGGTVSRSDTNNVVNFNNKSSNEPTLIGFMHNDEMWGYLGFKSKNTPIVYSGDLGFQTLLHSGNFSDYALPKDGGGTVTKYGALVSLILNSMNANGGTDKRSLIGFSKDDTTMGYLGFEGEGNPIFQDLQNARYPLLHTGNSNAVISASSAPSDTSALWYDTVNKMLKRYVDGAWQQ